MSSILTNNGAMTALQTLKSVNKNMADVQSQISTGKQINSAKDNAAVWAISKVMEADVTGFQAISDSLTLGESTVAVAKNASESVTDLLTEIKGKIISAQESNVPREKIQQDIDALKKQIESVVGSAQFNGLNLVDGSGDRSSDNWSPVKVMASLDRSSDGKVSANHINVGRVDLSSRGQAFGTGAALANEPANPASTGGFATNALAKTDINLAGTPADGTLTITVNGISLDITKDFATDTDDLDDMEGMIVEAINNSTEMQDAGITAVTDGTNGFNLTADEGFIKYSINGAGVTAVNDAEANVGTIDFGSGVPEEGDSYRVSFDGADYEYVASGNDTMKDVVAGLAEAINDTTGNGASAELRGDATSGYTLAMSNNKAGAAGVVGSGGALDITTASGGRAAGALEDLADLDVTTEDGLETALRDVEQMIQKSIDTASAFGSVQNRIEIQNDFVGKLMDSMKSGIGAMVDADMEETSARLQALQVQQQLGVQSLSMANQAPQSLLSLFQ